MKPISLHPGSVLAGLALAVLVALAAGAQMIQTTPLVGTGPVVVSTVPANRWVYLKLWQGGVPTSSYTVPSDRYLVITRVIGSFSNVTVNGASFAEELAAVAAGSAGAWADQGNTRVVLQPGDVLSGVDNYLFHVWGYLEPL